MGEIEKFEKITFLLKEIYNRGSYQWIKDIINFSKFEYHKHWNSAFPEAYNLQVLVDPEVYIKYFSSIDSYANIVKTDIMKISPLLIDKIKILPDYAIMQISNSEIMPVYTEWEEINIGQSKLIDQLRKGSDSFDFQNIGNTARTILLKLAALVFDQNKHKPEDSKILVLEGNYKNRLHSYIKAELKAEGDGELKRFALSAIDNIENAVDLANSTTHKLKAERILAEACIIGVISAISVIKLVESKPKTNF
jgi:hypothetical protein